MIPEGTWKSKPSPAALESAGLQASPMPGLACHVTGLRYNILRMKLVTVFYGVVIALLQNEPFVFFFFLASF